MFRCLLSALLLSLLACASAEAGVVRAWLPSVVRGGESVAVRVRAPGDARALVVVQERASGRWTAVTHGRASRRSFSLRWRAPRRRAVVRLRVVAMRSGRVVGVSPVHRVAVTLTAVLGASRIAAAPPSGSAGTLRYRGRVAVSAGEFVAAGVGEETPDGLLARVVAVRADGADTAVDVVPASLIEAVPSGRLLLGRSVARALRRSGAVGRRPFRAVFACGGDVGGDVAGSLEVSLVPSFELEWSRGSLRHAWAAATVAGEAQLSVRVDGPAACALAETPVASWLWPPLRAFVGPIPVVVVPQTTLYVSGEASASGAASASLHGRVSATAGLRWDGSVHPIGSFRHELSLEQPPEAAGDASLGARVIPSVTFLLYGQAGPSFDLSTGLQFSATPGRSPRWTLTAPVELRAGLAVPAFAGLTIPQLTVFSRTFPLAGAGAEAGAEADGGGDGSAPGSAPGRERARIAWDTGATDVDLHVWDGAGHHAWFRDPTAIPEATLSEDDRHGFGPELFHDASPGGRSLTFGLCYFDESGAGPTHVSVRLTGADGSVHESSVALAREGDHELIGSSPPGSGIVPPEGWCNP